MHSYKADVIIFGGGVAALWLHHRLRKHGYSALLIGDKPIGGKQSLAAQGIVHSGIKYMLAGNVSKVAKAISAMPDRWRAAIRGDSDEVDLQSAKPLAQSQLLLTAPGLMGGIVGMMAGGAAGADECAPSDDLVAAGFKGKAYDMHELVLDMPSVLHALAEPYMDSIILVDKEAITYREDGIVIADQHTIRAQHIIACAGDGNNVIAAKAGHGGLFKTQARPLLMGLVRNAPFDLYAHLVGASEKPIVSITTHYAQDGSRLWYLGGQVAERPEDAPAAEVYEATKAAFKTYMPDMDISGLEWAVYPVTRHEGIGGQKGWMPDRPTLHSSGRYLYGWPTKMTFAPLLSDMIIEKLSPPSGEASDWSAFTAGTYEDALWDRMTWS